MNISYLAIGTELNDGRIHEGNGFELARALLPANLSLSHSLSCHDSNASIIRSLQFLAMTSNVIVVSGGLGPTVDDCTREALQEMYGLEMELREDIVSHIQSLFESRGLDFPETNKKQALLPIGAEVISNQFGTAPGFSFSPDIGLTLYVLPGVPTEFSGMCKASVVPAIKKLFNRDVIRQSVSLHTYGMPESEIARRIQGVPLPEDMSLSILPEGHRISLYLQSDDQDALYDIEYRYRELLGKDYIFSDGTVDSLAEYVHVHCSANQASLAVAESCSGGYLSGILTSVPGCSTWYKGGIIAYANDVKVDMLAVDESTLEKDGAVSLSVAIQMARKVKKIFSTSYGLATTGVAGPDGGSAEKPVGTVYIAVADEESVACVKAQLRGTRHHIQKQTAYCAMDLLRRTVEGLPRNTFWYKEGEQGVV